jgi:hypothetical protein
VEVAKDEKKEEKRLQDGERETETERERERNVVNERLIVD